MRTYVDNGKTSKVYYYYIRDVDDFGPYSPRTVHKASSLDMARKSLINGLKRRNDWYVGVVTKVKEPTKKSDVVGIVGMTNPFDGGRKEFSWTYGYNGNYEVELNEEGKVKRWVRGEYR